MLKKINMDKTPAINDKKNIRGIEGRTKNDVLKKSRLGRRRLKNK
jgi:hypothetical protein